MVHIIQDSTEVVGCSVARTADVEFLLHKILGLERHVALGIADADNTSGERYGINSRNVGNRRTNSLNHHVGAHTVGVFHHLGEDVLLGRIDAIGSSSLDGQIEFLLAQIHSNDGSTTLYAADDGTKAHHTTTEYKHSVDVRHLTTAYCMESYRHRLDKSCITWGDTLHRDNLLPRKGNKFAHRAIALHTEGFIVLTRIVASIATRSAMSAIGIGIDGDHLTHMKISRATLSKCLDHSTNLMARDNIGLGHGISAKKRIEVAATETYILEPKQHFACSCYRLGEVHNLNLL